MQLPQSRIDETLTSEQIMNSSGLSQFHMTNEELEKTAIGKLHIVAVEGRNLAIKDITGSSDPYIIFKTSKSILKTTTIYKNLNPIWNEQFNVDVFDLSEDLEVCVMDEDLFKYDDFMGKFSVSIKELKPSKQIDSWYKLYPRKWNEKVSGDIHLLLTYESFEHQRENKKMITLKDVLNDSFSVQYFHDFLVKECSEENLLFHEACEEYKKKITGYGVIITEKDLKSLYQSALGIFETFIKPNGNFEVNIEFYIKEEYIKIFEVQDMKKISSLTFFDNAQIRTISIMELAFPNFLKSEEYENLLEKITWTQKFQFFPPLSRTESLSRLIHTFTDQDLMLMENLIKRKKKGTLSFKKPLVFAEAITDSPKEDEGGDQQQDDENDGLEFKKGDLLKVIRMDHLTGIWLCELNNRIGYVPNILLTTNIKQNESSTSITSTDYDNKLFRAKSYLKSFNSLERESFQSFFQEQKTSSGKIIRAGNVPRSLQDSYVMFDDEESTVTSFNVRPSEFDMFKGNSKSLKTLERLTLTPEEEEFIKQRREEKLTRVSKIKSNHAISLNTKKVVQKKEQKTVQPTINIQQETIVEEFKPKEEVKKSEPKEIQPEVKKKELSISIENLEREEEKLMSPSRLNSSMNSTNVQNSTSISSISKKGSRKTMDQSSSKSLNMNFNSEKRLSARDRSTSQVHKLISTFEKFSKKEKSDFFKKDSMGKEDELISNSSLLSFSTLK